MIRVVLDTNVVVSALISPFGNEALVIHAVQIGSVVPCYSRAIADEYAGVLVRPKFSFAPNAIEGLLSLLTSAGEIVTPRRLRRLSPDPKDDDFIACAMAANADFLVTGNKRHFPAGSYGPARVVSARELIEYLNTPRCR